MLVRRIAVTEPITLFDDSDVEEHSVQGGPGFLILRPAAPSAAPRSLTRGARTNLKALACTVRAVHATMAPGMSLLELSAVFAVYSDVQLAKLYIDHLWLKAFQATTITTGRPTHYDIDHADRVVLTPPGQGRTKLFLVGTYIDADEVELRTDSRGLYEGEGASLSTLIGTVARNVAHNSASTRTSQPRTFHYSHGYKSGKDHIYLKNWVLDSSAHQQVLSTLWQWGVQGTDHDLREGIVAAMEAFGICLKLGPSTYSKPAATNGAVVARLK